MVSRFSLGYHLAATQNSRYFNSVVWPRYFSTASSKNENTSSNAI